jgi:hypothetical protein
MAKYWFRQKRFGYGATPTTWQGWAVTFVSVVLLIVIVFAGRHIADPDTRMWVRSMGFIAVLIPTVVISYVKTEGGWRWRNGRD